MKMDELELTYEHYAYTLTKFGMTPESQEYFDTDSGNRVCHAVYIIAAKAIQERFQKDLKVFEEMLDEE
jgi:hypothetical protein